MNSTLKTVLSVVLFLFMVFAILFMHLACFDTFGDNLWYFYLLAIVAFLVQLVLMWFFFRQKQVWAFISFATIYALFFIFRDLYFLLTIHRYAPRPYGLDILALSLDLLGLLLCFLFMGQGTVLRPKVTSDKPSNGTGDGTVSQSDRQSDNR